MIWNPSRHILVESVKQLITDMEPFFKEIVDTYTDSEELRKFVIFWSLEDDPYVKEKIFSLQCQELFTLIDQDFHIPSQEPMDCQDLFPELECPTENNFYDTMQDESEQTHLSYPSAPKYFRPWEMNDTENISSIPSPQPENISSIPSPQPGPSGINVTKSQIGKGHPDNKPYTYEMRRKRTFAKNKAIDTTYTVKFNENWQGDKLKDLNISLHEMFDDILNKIRGDPTDLGRVVIHHNGLNHPIVVPLQQWEKLDSSVVMEGITNVLNSNEELIVDDSMSVTIGSIEIPKGSGGGKPITSLFGPLNSLQTKQSIFEVINDGYLCLPISIGLCYLKTCNKVKADEWNQLTAEDTHMSTMEKAIKYKVCPVYFYKNMLSKQRRQKMQADMGETLCKLANVLADRPLSLNDIPPFERLLDINVNVLSSKLGNKFVRVIDNPDVNNLFIYLVESDSIQHFHGIPSIAGFFGSSYYCENCMKPYAHRENHSCETTCDVCGSNECTVKTSMSCRSCHRECRSPECFIRHKEHRTSKKIVVPSRCDTWYKCRVCKKVSKSDDRNPSDHVCGEWKCQTCERYQVSEHFCYQRANMNESSEKKFIFYDFECRQDHLIECQQGYNVTKNRCDTCCNEVDPCDKCRICQHCHETQCGLYQHVVNLAVLQSLCPHCQQEDLQPKSKCANCGNRCVICSKKDKSGKYELEPCSDTCGFREHVFKGDNTCREFCTHIMNEHYKGSILIAHNAKAYDIYPILEVLIDRHAIRPDKIIYNGTKIMYMHIAKTLNLTFVDSLNFIPMKLADIPKAFGLEELCKGYFPHNFNRNENQSYVGSYPAPHYYGCDYMSSEDRNKFMMWHETKRSEIFDFQQEILKYCRSDVDILRRGCNRFRDVMMGATNGIDPFDYVTIAGVCMGIHKTLFLKEEHEIEIKDSKSGETVWVPLQNRDDKKEVLLNDRWMHEKALDSHLKLGRSRFAKSPIAMVPTDGYTRKDNYSKCSIQWLEWIMKQNNVHIRHALNGGEYRIPSTNYRADGYAESSNTIYEFHGCVYHGCPKCYPYDRKTTTHPTTNQSMEELYVVTKKRETEIKLIGYNYVAIWEHDFLNQLNSNQDIQRFVDDLDVQDRLNPRNSFFGGRTNAIRLHHKIQNTDETIEYYDFTSLYPWTNKYCRYPIGHPKIITDDFQDMSTYFGVAKVKVIPPRNLFHPVLPYTSNGKLKFPLCRTCADNENQNLCSCNDDQRTFIGTWCTPELMKAIEHGYKIIKTYEVYHFEESMAYDKTMGKEGLFSGYVNTFLKIKQEASGWPKECKTEEEKLQYIQNYEEREGIKLDYEKIEVNPGLRSFAKLCLNSFLGKFGQRLGLKQSRFLHDSEADVFFQMLSDPKKNIHDFHILTPEILQLEWSDDPHFLPLDTKTNIFLASFTTSWARLKLYSVLEEIGEDCLYMDTDSVIFIDRAQEHIKRLPVGNYLGELTNEIPAKQKHIVEYVSGGPKNYAFRTCDGMETCKVRGFTLNFANSRLINFDAVKDLLINSQIKTLEKNVGNQQVSIERKKDGTRKRKMGEKHVITITNPSKISRDATKRILYNRKENKQYQIVYTKRVVKPNLWTYPYGY